MFPTLALRCDLAVDESVSSWVSRLARVNGIDSASEFCLDMGLTLEGCDHGKPAALAKLCDLTGTPLPLLERASLRTDGYGRNLRGELLAPRMLRRFGIALCPQCIAEDIRYGGDRGTASAYGRTLWQLSVVRSCARHGCALVEIPPDPDTASADFTAHVRYSLKDILSHAEGPEPLPVSALQAYVEDRLEGHGREASWLDGMNLSAAVETCEALGILLTFGARTKLRRLSEEELHRAGDVGFQIMTQGETAIRASLTAISYSIPVQRRSRDGYSSRFGILYRSLAARRNNPAFAPMRTLLYHHIVETMPVGPGDTVLGLPVEKRVMHSIVTASRETGRHPKRLRKVLGAAGLIPPNHETLSDQYVKFDASTASDTLEANTTSLLLTDAAAYLHTSEQQMRMLTRRGFIRTYVERRRGDRARLLTYAIKDLDAFMARLTMHAEPIDHPSKMMVSIPVAARRAKCEAAMIIRWVLNKRVTRVGRHTGSEQYASILVDIREIVRQTNISVEGYVSIREAAGLLRRHRIVIDRLIADGHLSFVDGKFPSNNVSAKLIAKSEIQAFRETYISLQELARRLDIPKGWVAYRMGSIKPVIEQSRVGATYYRRDSVPHV